MVPVIILTLNHRMSSLALMRKAHEAVKQNDDEMEIWGTGSPRRGIFTCR